MSKTISFNGADNVGKTTQIKLLKKQLADQAVVVPSLPELNRDWEKVPGDFFWYFGHTQHEAWLELMLDSLFIRDQFIKSSSAEIVLVDRGIRMSLLYIAATLKERLKLESISSAQNLLVRYIAKNYGETPGTEDILILLKQSTDQATNISTTIERCAFTDQQMSDIYTRYQVDLNESLENLSGLPNCHTIIVGPKSIEEVNQEIRKKIGTSLPIC